LTRKEPGTSGFYDSHIHFMEGALSLERGMSMTQKLLPRSKRVKAFAAAHPKLLDHGARLELSGFPGGMPDRSFRRDRQDRPVYIEASTVIPDGRTAKL